MRTFIRFLMSRVLLHATDTAKLSHALLQDPTTQRLVQDTLQLLNDPQQLQALNVTQLEQLVQRYCSARFDLRQVDKHKLARECQRLALDRGLDLGADLLDQLLLNQLSPDYRAAHPKLRFIQRPDYQRAKHALQQQLLHGHVAQSTPVLRMLTGARLDPQPAWQGLKRIAQGQAEVGETLLQVSIETSTRYLVQHAQHDLSRALPQALVQLGVPNVSVRALTRANAHTALAGGIVSAGHSLMRYLKGEISQQQVCDEVSQTAVVGVSCFYYGAFGQAVIPVPVVGAFIGSTVGYFIGHLLHQSGLIGLGECTRVKAARERREQIEAMCLTAIPVLRAHRVQFQQLLEQQTKQRKQQFSLAFDHLERSNLARDTAGFLQGLESINQLFGSSLPFKSFSEFDAAMRDPNVTFDL